MIHPSTQIDLLDLERGENMHCSIEEVFQKYAEYIEWRNVNKGLDWGSLAFHDRFPEKIKIQDWMGWTELKSILVQKTYGIVEWCKLQTATDDFINVTARKLIPIWDPNVTIRGFHGETKYAFHLKEASEIVEGDLLRTRRYYSESVSISDPSQFVPVTKIDSESDALFYQINTQSKFYNANDFLMYQDLIVPYPLSAGDGYK